MRHQSRFSIVVVAAAAFVAGGTSIVSAASFDGVSDYGVDNLGWYYAITGGQFPTGTTPNGDNGTGGTFRFVSDDPVIWGRNISESGNWQKDDWFPQNAGLGLTLRNGGTIVYDNNGLEPDAATSADPQYYDYASYETVGKGVHVAYSMSNNYDWVYAGYFKITSETEVDSLTGYFARSAVPADALTNGFDPDNPYIGYRMNIWSNVDGDLLPTDTSSFDGDVFTSDTATGTFAWSDTGFNRIGSTSTQDIYRLTYTLDTPITLQAGEYWFSHDATVPEPSSIGLLGVGALALLRRPRRK